MGRAQVGVVWVGLALGAILLSTLISIPLWLRCLGQCLALWSFLPA